MHDLEITVESNEKRINDLEDEITRYKDELRTTKDDLSRVNQRMIRVMEQIDDLQERKRPRSRTPPPPIKRSRPEDSLPSIYVDGLTAQQPRSWLIEYMEKTFGKTLKVYVAHFKPGKTTTWAQVTFVDSAHYKACLDRRLILEEEMKLKVSTYVHYPSSNTKYIKQ